METFHMIVFITADRKKLIVDVDRQLEEAHELVSYLNYLHSIVLIYQICFSWNKSVWKFGKQIQICGKA